MKIKKMLTKIGLPIAVLSLLALFTSCGNKSNNYPTATLSIKNGSLNIDPAQVNYIDISFDTAMDTKYGGWVSYNDSIGDILSCGWYNSYTYRFVLDLRYDASFKVIINDDEYANSPNAGSYTKENSYFRDLDGNFLKMYPIEFSTIPSKITSRPHTFEISMPEFSCKLVQNDYTLDNVDYTNQNYRTTIKPLLNHEVLKAGDTLKIKFKAYSTYDVKNLRAQLCDLSGAANGWAILNEKPNGDIVVISELKATTDEENPNYYSGEITFKLEKGMASSSLEIELFADYIPSDENAELYDLNFVPVEK